jgi:hypothetical protein
VTGHDDAGDFFHVHTELLGHMAAQRRHRIAQEERS